MSGPNETPAAKLADHLRAWSGHALDAGAAEAAAATLAGFTALLAKIDSASDEKRVDDGPTAESTVPANPPAGRPLPRRRRP